MFGGLFLLALMATFVSVRYYSFVFAKTVHGTITGIDRVTQANTLIGTTTQIPPSQIFSFAIAIKELGGNIVTASSEDRQWAVAEKGQCVEAKFFPYPPWQLDKSGTFYGARLLKLSDCPQGTE